MHGKLVGRSAPRSCGTAGVSTRCARPPLRYGPSGDTPPAPRLGWQLWALRPGLDACVPTVHNVPGTRRATELRTPHRTGTAGSGLGSGTAGSPAGGAGCAVSLCRRRVDVLTEPTGGPFSRGRRASCEKRVRPSFCLRPRGERGSADGTQRSQDDSDRHCGRGAGAAGVHGACLPVMRASTREEMRRISSTSRSSSRLFSIHSR